MLLTLVCTPMVLAAAGCGGGSSPASPSPPSSPGASGITVRVTTPLRVGQTAQGTATLSQGGSSQTLTSGFRSDNTSVATVTDDGRVTGVARGSATISVESGGARGSQAVRVVPSYQGSWQGTYGVSSCTATDDFNRLGFCATLTAQVGAAAPVLFVFRQSGDSVTASFQLGAVRFAETTVTLEADGTLPVTATADADTNTTIEAAWRVSSPVDGQIAATYRQTWTHRTLSGSAIVEGALLQARRTSDLAALQGLTVPRSAAGSLDAAIRLLGRP